MFGIGKTKNTKVVKPVQKVQPNVIINIPDKEEQPKEVKPKDLEFFTRERNLNRDEAMKDLELNLALIEFRKAYCAAYRDRVRGISYENGIEDIDKWRKIDEIIFGPPANFHSYVGALEFLFIPQWDRKDIYDYTGFRYIPFTKDDWLFCTQEQKDYFENIIEPECLRLGIDKKSDYYDTYENDSSEIEVDTTNDNRKYGKNFYGPYLSADDFIEFMNRMKNEILCGTFPVVVRLDEPKYDNSQSKNLWTLHPSPKLGFSTAYSIPSLANAVYQLAKCATPNYPQITKIIWKQKDPAMFRFFNNSVLTCVQNPLDEGYPVQPARKVKMSCVRVDFHKYEKYYKDYFINPETFVEDCFKLAKQIVLYCASYTNRQSAIIVDEPGKEGELLQIFKNSEYAESLNNTTNIDELCDEMLKQANQQEWAQKEADYNYDYTLEENLYV